MGSPLATVLLLVASNVFMTFAWYAHLRYMASRPWWAAALVSWGIALFEYLLQVPANRIGARTLSLAQLKIMHEVNPRRVRAVRGALHAPADQPQLPLGRPVPDGSGLLYVPVAGCRLTEVYRDTGSQEARRHGDARRAHACRSLVTPVMPACGRLMDRVRGRSQVLQSHYLDL